MTSGEISLRERIDIRAAELLERQTRTSSARIDRLFAGLMMLQWVGGIVVAAWIAPHSWEGMTSYVHPHVWAAIFLGAMIAVFPIGVAFLTPGRSANRYVISAGQAMHSAMLIHVTGGRIETHFHIFGSLAFLAFYRDWRVLIPATLVTGADHAFRGMFWPQSVFGTFVTSHYRWLEHFGWILFEDVFLIWACVRSSGEMKTLAFRQAELEATNDRIAAEVARKTAEIEEMNRKLVNAARQAGMAEIATGVLHNVGNVLNSVNVAASIATDHVRTSELSSLRQVSDLIQSRGADIGPFITNDDRGRLLPGFIVALADCLRSEQDLVLREFEVVRQGLDHIKQVIAAQQTFAKGGGGVSMISPAALVETALTIQGDSLRRHGIRVIRDISYTKPVRVDENRVLQILINLVANAKDAMHDVAGERSLYLGVRIVPGDFGQGCVRFVVRDTGKGIAPENLVKIFAHGFTTRTDGHGFGLHSSANSAREMGGSLTVVSDGPGKGATFTLDIPVSSRPSPGRDGGTVEGLKHAA